MNLTPEDVHDILRLLDQVPVDEFELQTDRFHLRLRRTPDEGWAQSTRVLAPPRPIQPPADEAPASEEPGPATGTEPDLEGRSAVRAPLPGSFYRAPRPGADPFVEVGDRVEPGTVVGIVETMKLMNSVHADVQGTVAEIRKANAEFADKGEVLLVVDPDPS